MNNLARRLVLGGLISGAALMVCTSSYAQPHQLCHADRLSGLVVDLGPQTAASQPVLIMRSGRRVAGRVGTALCTGDRILVPPGKVIRVQLNDAGERRLTSKSSPFLVPKPSRTSLADNVLMLIADKLSPDKTRNSGLMGVRTGASSAPATFGLPGLENTSAIVSQSDVSKAFRILIEPRPVGMVEIALTDASGEALARATNEVANEVSFGGMDLRPGDYGLVLTDRTQGTSGQRRGGFSVTAAPPPRPESGLDLAATQWPRGVSNDILALWLSCVGPTTHALRAYQLVRSEPDGLEKATVVEAIVVADKLPPRTEAQCSGKP
jgi:hypothetical protein